MLPLRKTAATSPRPNPATTEAWCGCGLRFAGTQPQIVYAASVHWMATCCRWQLHRTDPRKETKS